MKRSLLTVVVALALLGVLIVRADAARAGCGPVAHVAEPDVVVTAFRDRLGGPTEPALLQQGTIVTGQQLELGFAILRLRPELQVQLELLDANEDFDGDGVVERGLRQFIGEHAIEARTTEVDFLEAGGILLQQRPAVGIDAALVKSQVGERAVLVEVSRYEAALVWADPISAAGTRPHHLYWSDGSRDVTLIADVSAAKLVELARSLYCE